MLDEAVIGIAQWLAAPDQPQENLRAALDHIGRLARDGCDLIALPEMWPCGYTWATIAADARRCAEPLDGPRVAALSRAARAAGAWLAAGSVPELDEGQVYNTALLFARDGSLHAYHRKAHLYAPAGEDVAFAAGDRLTVCATDDFGPLGLCVCFDGDFPELARGMALRGARVVVSANAYELAAAAWWERLYPANALANGQWWIMANQCGTTASGTLLGGSQIIAPSGQVVARAGIASQGESPAAELLVARIALRDELDRAAHEASALWQLRRPELYGALAVSGSARPCPPQGP